MLQDQYENTNSLAEGSHSNREQLYRRFKKISQTKPMYPKQHTNSQIKAEADNPQAEHTRQGKASQGQRIQISADKRSFEHATSHAAPISNRNESVSWLNEPSVDDSHLKSSQITQDTLNKVHRNKESSSILADNIQKKPKPTNLLRKQQNSCRVQQQLQSQQLITQGQSFNLIHGHKQRAGNSGLTFSQKNVLNLKNTLHNQQLSPQSAQNNLRFGTSLNSSSMLLGTFQGNTIRQEHQNQNITLDDQQVLLSENPCYQRPGQTGRDFGSLSPKAVERPQGFDQNVSRVNHFDLGKVSGKISQRTNPYSQQRTSFAVGSTAPSQHNDRLTASHVNSCSQFITGGQSHGRPGTCVTYQTCNPNTLETTRINIGTLGTNMRNTAENSIEHDQRSSLSKNSELTQVAQSLLSQVKPGILKMLQNKIESVVLELCEQGVQDQETILKEVEQRASQFFPKNYNQYFQTNNSIVSSDSCAQINSQVINSHLFTDQFSASDQTLHLHQLGHPLSAMNGMSTIDRGSTDDMLDTISKRQRDGYTLRDMVNFSDNGGLSEFEMSQDEIAKRGALEALIEMNMAQQQQSRENMGKVANAEPVTCQTEHEQGSSRQEIVQHLIEMSENAQQNRLAGVGPVYMNIISPDRESGNLEANLGVGNEQLVFPKQVRKKNLASRAPQKSDDFKVTFAYTSNKSSIDGKQIDAQKLFQDMLRSQSNQESPRLPSNENFSQNLDQAQQQQQLSQDQIAELLLYHQKLLAQSAQEHSGSQGLGVEQNMMSSTDKLWHQMAGSERLDLLESQQETNEKAKNWSPQNQFHEHPQPQQHYNIQEQNQSVPTNCTLNQNHYESRISYDTGMTAKMATQNSDLVQQLGEYGFVGTRENTTEVQKIANSQGLANSQEYITQHPPAMTASGKVLPPYAIQHKSKLNQFSDTFSTSRQEIPQSKKGSSRPNKAGTTQSKPSSSKVSVGNFHDPKKAPSANLQTEGNTIINIRREGVTDKCFDNGQSKNQKQKLSNEDTRKSRKKRTKGSKVRDSTSRRSESKSLNSRIHCQARRQQPGWRDNTWNYGSLLAQLDNKSFKAKLSRSLQRKSLFADASTKPHTFQGVLAIKNGRVMTLSPSDLTSRFNRKRSTNCDRQRSASRSQRSHKKLAISPVNVSRFVTLEPKKLPVSTKNQPILQSTPKRQNYGALSTRLPPNKANGRSLSPQKSKIGYISKNLHTAVMKEVRKASRDAKQCLKRVYKRQVQQLKSKLEQELDHRDRLSKQEAAFQRHTTNLHRQRADTYKKNLKGLEQQVREEKEKNAEIMEWASRQSPARKVLHRNRNKMSRSQSFAQRSTFFGLGLTQEETTTPAKLMDYRGTYCPGYKGGFSYISKSLPRNNHHFTNRKSLSRKLSRRRLFNEAYQPMMTSFESFTHKQNQSAEQLINIRQNSVQNLKAEKMSQANHDEKTTKDDIISQGKSITAHTRIFSQDVSSARDYNAGVKQAIHARRQASFQQNVDCKRGRNNSRQMQTQQYQQQSKQMFGSGIVRRGSQSSLERDMDDSQISIQDHDRENYNHQNWTKSSHHMQKRLKRRNQKSGRKNSAISKRQASGSGTFNDISRVKAESSDFSIHPHQRVSTQNMFDLSLINEPGGKLNDKHAQISILNATKQDQVHNLSNTASNLTSSNAFKQATIDRQAEQGIYSSRREASIDTDISWTSSDLDQEYLDDELRGKDSHGSFTTRINRYSKELLVNRKRLVQIQKILYSKEKDQQEASGNERGDSNEELNQDRKRRHGRGRGSQRGKGRSHERKKSIEASLPQILEKLRNARNE